MSPFVNDPDFVLHVGDALDVLGTLPDESVHCVVTSPPYWGLRDYGTGSWDGGDDGCDHLKPPNKPDPSSTLRDAGRNTHQNHAREPWPNGSCGKCGARRVDHQLGLENTPDEYVTSMVNVFREVRRVLRRDGTCWLNIGDSYASQPAGNAPDKPSGFSQKAGRREGGAVALPVKDLRGLKPKDLVGIPWRLAFALQQPYYTGTIKDERDRIWLAAMVEAEGCMFLHKRGVGQYASSFTKQDGTASHYHRKNATFGAGLEVASTDRVIVERCLAIAGKGSIGEQTRGRKRTLYRWMLRSNECRDVIRELYPHFVVKHHEARLLIGCPSSGEKAEAAWAGLKEIHGGGVPAVDFAAPESLFEPGWYVRSDIVWSKLNPMPESVTDRPTKAHEYLFLLTKSPRYFYDADAIRQQPKQWAIDGRSLKTPTYGPHRKTEGARPYEVRTYDRVAGANARSVWEIATEPYPDAHFATFPQALVAPCLKAGCPEGGTVLDPFMGSGTVAVVARRLGRRAVGIELNPEYAALASTRLQQLSLLAA